MDRDAWLCLTVNRVRNAGLAGIGECVLPKETPYGLMDLFVVLTCSLAFAIVIGPGRHVATKGPPIGLIAQELGTTPEQLQRAEDKFFPPAFFPSWRIGPPTEAQKRQVATTLNVSVERLDTVMEKYRPGRLEL